MVTETPSSQEYRAAPVKHAGRKPGNKSDLHHVLKRIVQIGQMMDSQGMTLTEIYSWNMEPEQAEEWGYSVRQVSEMCRRARLLGMEALKQTHAENVRRSLRQFQALFNAAMEEKEFRVAYCCVLQIARIRLSYCGVSKQSKTDPVTGKAFIWHSIT